MWHKCKLGILVLGLQRYIVGSLLLPRCMQQQGGGVVGCVPDADKGPVAQLPPPPPPAPPAALLTTAHHPLPVSRSHLRRTQLRLESQTEKSSRVLSHGCQLANAKLDLQTINTTAQRQSHPKLIAPSSDCYLLMSKLHIRYYPTVLL